MCSIEQTKAPISFIISTTPHDAFWELSGCTVLRVLSYNSLPTIVHTHDLMGTLSLIVNQTLQYRPCMLVPYGVCHTQRTESIAEYKEERC